MNVLEALANPAKLRKLAQLALFLPAIIQARESVVAKMPDECEAVRKATAVGLIERLIVQLARRGYVPGDLQEGLQVAVSDLYDSVVGAFG